MRYRKTTWLFLLAIATTITLASIYFFGKNAPARTEIRHIVFISIDTCRADHLSCYGYARKITPNIDAIAENATLFENTISCIPQTLPSHCTMMTGKTPLCLGIHENLGYKLGDSNETLAEILHDQGYVTGAIVSSFVLDSQFGLDQGFDSYNDQFENAINTSNYSERRGDEASSLAIQWLQERKDDRFFLFLHYFDPHFRYTPPEPYSVEFADDLYAGEIAYTDHCIGQVVDKLKELGLYDSTLIIIAGDHGEMLGEHGEAEHGFFIYQSAIKVPLIVKMPGQSQPKRTDRLVGLIDIVPTVCNLLGIEEPKPIQGHDLSGFLLKGQEPDENRYIYCESFLPTKHNANALLGMVTDGWKYIQTNRPELYDLIADPKETKNLINEESKRAHILREHLKLAMEERSHDDSNSEHEMDAEGRKRLESLGYIASIQVDDSLEFDENKDDPKDVIKFQNIKAYNDMAIALANQGKLDEAVAAFKDIIEHYEKVQITHSMANLHVSLGTVLKMQGKPQESTLHLSKAIALYRAELKAKPNSASEICPHLGNTLASMGDFKGASEAFAQALAYNKNPQNFQNLARSLEYQRLYDQAAAVLGQWLKYEQNHGSEANVARLKNRIEQLKSKKTQGN